MRKERAIVMSEELERLRVAAAVKRDAGVRKHFTPIPGISETLASTASTSAPEERLIWAPKGRTQRGLATLAHEAGHVATQPPSKDLLSPAEVVEWEYYATKWGFDAIKRNGGKVTPKMVRDNRMAIMTYVKGLEVPIETLPREITSFLQGASA